MLSEIDHLKVVIKKINDDNGPYFNDYRTEEEIMSNICANRKGKMPKKPKKKKGTY